ncbi:hypothetical protein ABMA28_008537, partial [Loxostege sticticalis]
AVSEKKDSIGVERAAKGDVNARAGAGRPETDPTGVKSRRDRPPPPRAAHFVTHAALAAVWRIRQNSSNRLFTNVVAAAST